MKEPNLELATAVVAFLNELIALDKPAIAALIANRVPCNGDLASHESVQVVSQHGGFHVGILGVLNGLCGTYEDNSGLIAVVFSDREDGPGELLYFEVRERNEN